MKKSITKEIISWFKSILIAIFAATLIRWGTFENFTIPSSSMESTLMTGDTVVVSKLHYGPRIPITPLQIPLTHQFFWGTKNKAYSSIIKLPYYRLPGFSSIQRGDKVVFNDPIELEYPTDIKTYFIKRCIGLPNDVIKISKGNIYVNNQLVQEPPTLQNQYIITSDQPLSRKFFLDRKIYEFYEDLEGYVCNITDELAEKISKLEYIKSVEKVILDKNDILEAILGFPEKLWNTDNFGPLKIPHKGMTIQLNNTNTQIYKFAILHLEDNKNIEVKDGNIWINNELARSYTFKKNYYFMVGDNRKNSRDSRFWGFVPEDHILGKAIMILYSQDIKAEGATIFSKIRWSRFFKMIK